MTQRPVAVVGLGLIGGSVAGALRHVGRTVRGWDQNPWTTAIARKRNLIDESAESLEDVVTHADAVILAIPVLATLEVIARADFLASPDSLIIDTGSVKGPIMRVMQALPGAARCIGGHPLAGRELSGPEAARIDLFQKRPFVLTPSIHTSASCLEGSRSLVESLGAHATVMDADTHDRIVARTSHMPQVLSSALALAIERSDEPLVGTGFSDMTRLARSDVRMWRDILLANRDYILDAVDRLTDQLEALVQAIRRDDGQSIESLLGAARQSAEQLERSTE